MEILLVCLAAALGSGVSYYFLSMKAYKEINDLTQDMLRQVDEYKARKVKELNEMVNNSRKALNDELAEAREKKNKKDLN